MALSFTRSLTKVNLDKLNEIIKNIRLIKESGEQHKSAQIMLIRMYRLCGQQNAIANYFSEALVIEGVCARRKQAVFSAKVIAETSIPDANGQLDKYKSNQRAERNFKRLLNGFPARDAYVAIDSNNKDFFVRVSFKQAMQVVNDVLSNVKQLTDQLASL